MARDDQSAKEGPAQGSRERRHLSHEVFVKTIRPQGFARCVNISTCSPVLETGVKGDRTGPARAQCSGTRCASTSRTVFRCSPPRSCTSSRSSTSCLWFLRGDDQCALPAEHGVTIWDEWADANGELGPDLRPPVALLAPADGATSTRSRRVVEQMKRDPDSRRHRRDGVEVRRLDQMALAPCHCLFQFYVAEGRLSCQLYQRSRRHLPGRALQYRFLCAADADGGAGDRPQAGRIRPHLRRCAPVPQPPGAGAMSSSPRAARAAAHGDQPGRTLDPRFRRRDFKLDGYDLHPPSGPRWRCEPVRRGGSHSSSP